MRRIVKDQLWVRKRFQAVINGDSAYSKAGNGQYCGKNTNKLIMDGYGGRTHLINFPSLIWSPIWEKERPSDVYTSGTLFSVSPNLVPRVQHDL